MEQEERGGVVFEGGVDYGDEAVGGFEDEGRHCAVFRGIYFVAMFQSMADNTVW
jgi:hypothetical protein